MSLAINVELLPREVEEARVTSWEFIRACRDVNMAFRLTLLDKPTPYALCFGVFGLHLLKERGYLAEERDAVAEKLRMTIRAERRMRDHRPTDKPYRQLLAFILSALAILDALVNDPLEELICEQIPEDVGRELRTLGCLEGSPQSGNQAMFIAVFLLHARDVLGLDSEGALHQWVELHLKSMNRFGFWGPSSSMSHIQFQNGYHQYEVLEYLNAEVPLWNAAADHVASLADDDGHFAPYPGGGSCYDYDAVFLITGAGEASVQRHRELLVRTAKSILTEQNADGGFCESHLIRPRSFLNLMRTWRHVWAAQGKARVERFRQGLTLMRPCHDRIHTHWSNYSRKWSESNLWDSWFRMLTLARIEVATEPSAVDHWGFIDYPGIGYHHLLRRKLKGGA